MKSDNRAETFVHQSFRIGILLKGLDGVLEIMGGLILTAVSPETINRLLLLLIQHELSKDPRDVIANFLVRAVHDLSLTSKTFAVIYLLSHGVVKVFVVASLLKNRLWAYPVAILFFIAFTLYQVYRYSLSHSIWMLALTIFDIVVIFLTWAEYRNVKKERCRG